LKGVEVVDVTIEVIFPPQQNPTTPQALMVGEKASMAAMVDGIRATAAGGEPFVAKNSPRSFSFSGESGGYLWQIRIHKDE
jgi:hypothetical protein